LQEREEEKTSPGSMGLSDSFTPFAEHIGLG
jgi:hypothetical protein